MTAPALPPRRTRRHQTVSLTAAALVLAAGAAQAGIDVSWAAAVDGNWGDGFNWNTGVAPLSGNESVELGLAGPYTVTVTLNRVAESLLISNVDARIDIINARTLSIGNDLAGIAELTNDGVITVNSQPGSSFSSLVVGTATVPGILQSGPNNSGEVILNVANGNGDFSDATLDIRSGGTHADGHTVRGKGRVVGVFTNEGLILADRAGQELRVSGDGTQTATGVMRATGEGVLGIGDSGSVSGGTLTTDALGQVRVVSGTATLSGGVIIEGDAGATTGRTLNIGSGGVVNNGVLSVNANQGTATTQIFLTTDATIAGNGSVDLNIANPNGDFNDAILTTGVGVTGTIGADHSVTGKGTVGGVWINNGTINADRAGQELRVAGDITQSANGTLRASGGTLGLANGATINGGLVTTDNGGIVTATISSATVGGGLQNLGDMGINSGQVLAIGAGGIINDGTITVNAQPGTATTLFRFDENETIGGTGVIDLNIGNANGDFGDAQITTALGVVGTFGPGQTITGKGQLNGDFVLDGTIEADRANQDLLIIGTLDASNGGVIRATNDAFAVVSNADITGATLESDNGGSVLVRFANSTFDGVTNTGDAGIRSGSTLGLVSDFTNNGTFTVNSQTGTATTICLVTTDGVAIRGSGTIDLNIGDPNGDLGDAQLETADGVTATNAASHTITGKGRVDGSWNNNGTISGNRLNQDLQLQGTFDQSGGGTIRGDDGGFALIRNSEITGGFFDSSNGGSVDFIGANNAVDGVTSQGDTGLRSSAVVKVRQGGITNNGTLSVNNNASTASTALDAENDATIDGNGEIFLGISEANGDLSDATLGADEGFTLTIGAGQTITGKGRLRGLVTVEGTIAPGNNPGGDEIDTVFVRPNATSEGITLASTCEFAVEATAEEVNDRISSTVPVTIQGGTLRFTPTQGFEPPRPSRYTIIEAPEITGIFDTLIYEGILPDGAVFRAVYEEDEVIAAVTCKADIAAPIGVLDLQDISFFTQLFLAGSPLVDLAPPSGVLDLADIGTFVTEFLAGCSE